MNELIKMSSDYVEDRRDREDNQERKGDKKAERGTKSENGEECGIRANRGGVKR
ncbi:MAG: hypothetical protein U9N41_09530 [Euryarchaeota archaeon]|nr:hypothetical protein [Euryarchaeota archaeon]